MESVSDKVASLVKQFFELEQLNKERNKALSDVDIELSACYHKIEGIKITHVAQSHKLIKELKDILIRRRQIKLETLILRSTCDSLRGKVNDVNSTTKNALIQHEKVLKEITERAK